MMNKNTLKVFTTAAIASSMIFAQAIPAFAEETNFYAPETDLVEKTSAITVTYDKNCSDDVEVPEKETADDEDMITISYMEPERDGYTFIGWSEDKNADENDALLQAGDNYYLNGSIKLYAIWEKDEVIDEEDTIEVEEDTNEEAVNDTISYQVMLDTHGGSMSVDHVDSDQDGVATLPMEEPVKTNCTFLGWADSPETNVVVYYPGAQIQLDSDLKLYAVWEEDAPVVTYQVMLDTTGGSMSIHSVNSDEHGIVTLPAEKPVKDGYTFLGWAEDPQSGNVAHQPGETLTLTNDMKLYAVWQENSPVISYQVMLDTTGGSASIHSVNSDEHGIVTLPSEKPVKDGYTFLGWAEDPQSGVVKHQPGETFTLTNDMKLYAVWEAVKPAVQASLIFDANGGTGGPTTVKANADGTVTIPTLMPVRNGYKFLGWSSDAKAAQASYTPGQTITINADFKLYAVWQSNKNVNTGVQNNTMFYVFTAIAAVIFAGSVFMIKKKEQ